MNAKKGMLWLYLSCKCTMSGALKVKKYIKNTWIMRDIGGQKTSAGDNQLQIQKLCKFIMKIQNKCNNGGVLQKK